MPSDPAKLPWRDGALRHIAAPSSSSAREREKRAKIIAAEGELRASKELLEAANVISQNPAALQMRYLQTLTEIAVEKNSTILFPLPIDLFRGLIRRGEEAEKANS